MAFQTLNSPATDPLRMLLEEDRWKALQLQTANDLLNGIMELSDENRNSFEEWIISQSVSERKSPSAGRLDTVLAHAPAGANWCVNWAGAVIPVAFIGLSPLAAISVALLFSTGAMILGNRAQAAIADALADARGDLQSIDMINFAIETEIEKLRDPVLTGMLSGKGGMTDTVASLANEAIVGAGKTTCGGLLYKMKLNPGSSVSFNGATLNLSYFRENPSFYFSEVPLSQILNGAYILCRSLLNDNFSRVATRGYGENQEENRHLAGRAMLAAYWTIFERYVFETAPREMMPVPEPTGDRFLKRYPTPWDLPGHAVGWNTFVQDHTLAVWLPCNEQDLTLNEFRRRRSNDNEIAYLRSYVEEIWERRADENATFCESYADARVRNRV